MNIRDRLIRQLGELVLVNMELADALEIERAKAALEKPETDVRRGIEADSDGNVTAIR